MTAVFFLIGTQGGLCAENPANPPAQKVDNDTCLACHGDPAEEPFVDSQKFGASVHGASLCVDCHADLAQSDFPHDSPLKPVDCGICHEDEQAELSDSLHGRALAAGDKLAPHCQHCHGYHDVLPVKDKNSKVSPLNIPFVCGSCHSEGKPAQLQREIHQDHILENYSESIHGERLFKKSLTVTP